MVSIKDGKLNLNSATGVCGQHTVKMSPNLEDWADEFHYVLVTPQVRKGGTSFIQDHCQGHD
jgi:hypothetical protein